MVVKVCKTCGEGLPVSSFYRAKGTADGLRGSCKACHAEAGRQWRLNNPEKLKIIVDRANKKDGRKRSAKTYRNKHRARVILRAAKQRSDKYNIPYDLSETDVVLPEVCPIMGIALDYGLDKIEDHSPSLDRIKPELGYVKGNVQVISNLANRMKSNATPEQLLVFSEWINKTYV